MRLFLSILIVLAFSLHGHANSPVVLKLENVINIGTGETATRFCAHAANDAESRTKGLMFQTDLPQRAGMIFDFQKNDTIHMWMRNTVLPLDMIFISADLKVVKIAKDTKPFSLDIISSDGPARYVLEVNAGISEKYDIAIGDPVEFAGTNCSLP